MSSVKERKGSSKVARKDPKVIEAVKIAMRSGKTLAETIAEIRFESGIELSRRTLSRIRSYVRGRNGQARPDTKRAVEARGGSSRSAGVRFHLDALVRGLEGEKAKAQAVVRSVDRRIDATKRFIRNFAECS